MRTAICRYCATGNLEWVRTPYGNRLRDRATQQWHRCLNGTGADTDTTTETAPAADPMPAVKVAVDELNRLGARVETLSQRVSALASQPAATNGHGPTDADVAELVNGTVSTALNLATAGIRDRVSAAIADMVPVRHEIVVRRPDGTEITTDGRPHRQFRLLLSIVATGTNVLLVGPAGSGKSSAAEMTAQCLGRGFAEQSFGPRTMENDLVGFVSPIDRQYHRTAFRDAFEYGYIFSADEMDNANASVLTALNSALSNGHYAFPDGEIVKRHADFVMVASANTYGRGADRQYVGRQQLDAATLDRFATLEWGYDEDAEADWAGAGSAEWVAYVQRIRHAIADLGPGAVRHIVSPRASIAGYKLLSAGIDRATVEDLVIWKGLDADARSKVAARAGV